MCFVKEALVSHSEQPGPLIQPFPTTDLNDKVKGIQPFFTTIYKCKEVTVNFPISRWLIKYFNVGSYFKRFSQFIKTDWIIKKGVLGALDTSAVNAIDWIQRFDSRHVTIFFYSPCRSLLITFKINISMPCRYPISGINEQGCQPTFNTLLEVQDSSWNSADFIKTN